MGVMISASPSSAYTGDCGFFKYLPERAEAALKAAVLPGRYAEINEIRLRLRRPASLTVGGKYVSMNYRADGEELKRTVLLLCGNSIHTCEESIIQGFIAPGDGCRAGICGRAVVKDGIICAVTDITSVTIRIPLRRVINCSHLIGLLERTSYRRGLLIFSPPGGGKTTYLRSLAAVLSSPPYSKRVSVADSRCEIWQEDMFSMSEADFLLSYPKPEAIAIATRTLCPELVICDEIGNEAEVTAILEAQNTGVPLIASAHGGSFDEIMRRPQLKRLFDAGVFGYAVSVSREGTVTEYETDF